MRIMTCGCIALALLIAACGGSQQTEYNDVTVNGTPEGRFTITSHQADIASAGGPGGALSVSSAAAKIHCKTCHCNPDFSNCECKDRTISP